MQLVDNLEEKIFYNYAIFVLKKEGMGFFMKNNNLKKILPIVIIIVVIITIIIGIILIALIKKQTQEISIDPNGDSIVIVNESDNKSIKYIDTESIDINNGKKMYQEMNRENYYEANKDNKTFRIQDVIHNTDGTITIKGRVYQYLNLPSTLSANEYQALLDGKSLNILGEKVTKVQDDSIANEAGYDIALKIETQKYDYNIYYYAVEDEESQTAELYNGSDSSIAEGTNVYLQKTLSGDFECSYYGERIALKDYYKNDVHIEDLNKTRLLHKNNKFVIDEEDGTFLRLVVVGN